MKCRHCGFELKLPFVDLGSAPPSNAYLTEQALKLPEKRFPLRVLVCERCWLVQTEDFSRPDELFDPEYAYFSGFSSSWLTHCERYVADMIARYGLNASSHVIEIAANDGSLLQYVKKAGIRCLGIEPTKSTASAARQKGIDIIESFFGVKLAQKLVLDGKQADLMVANNVLPHVPEINDFLKGFAILLKPEGVVTFEFPHLLKLVQDNQFDTIYHEHFSYISLTVALRIFAQNGLTVFEVEELPTHGGSLRIYAQRSDTGKYKISERVSKLASVEAGAGITTAGFYAGFQARADRVKDDFLSFLIKAKNSGKTVAAYAAAAKGNTLLNYAGVSSDLIAFVVDRNPVKQGKFTPGSHIPIVDESRLTAFRPDYVVIFSWNIKEEIMAQLSYIKDWGGMFVTAVPRLEVRG